MHVLYRKFGGHELPALCLGYRSSCFGIVTASFCSGAGESPASQSPLSHHTWPELRGGMLCSRPGLRPRQAAQQKPQFETGAVLWQVGIQFVSPVHEFPEDKWDAIMDVCLNSAFHATKAALPYMMEQQWGRSVM